MIGESDVPWEQNGDPIAAQRHVHSPSQLFQWGKVIGWEMVGQSYMKLLLMWFHMNICVIQGDKNDISIICQNVPYSTVIFLFY